MSSEWSGAGFPTCHKLDIDLRAEGNADGYVLVNASECEPGLRHNIQQIEEDHFQGSGRVRSMRGNYQRNTDYHRY